MLNKIFNWNRLRFYFALLIVFLLPIFLVISTEKKSLTSISKYNPKLTQKVLNINLGKYTN